MQVFRTIAQFTFFRSHGLCVKVEDIFMNNFRLYFWGGFPKMAIKSSIIALETYIIPHFKAKMPWHASVSRQRLFHKPVLCEYRLNGSRVTHCKKWFLCIGFWKYIVFICTIAHFGCGRGTKVLHVFFENHFFNLWPLTYSIDIHIAHAYKGNVAVI